MTRTADPEHVDRPPADHAGLSDLCASLLAHGASLAADLHRGEGVGWKAEYDVVSAADLHSEEVLAGLLQQHFPGDGLVSEEGLRRPSQTGALWLVDPLDGTMNYVRGDRLWGMSLARSLGGVVMEAVLLFPEMGVLATATRGGGAFVAGQRLLAPTRRPRSGQAVLATKFGMDRQGRREHGRLLGSMLEDLADVRRSGCTSWDLLQVSRGVWDGYLGRDVRTWDVAAGGLLLEEAGASWWYTGPVDDHRYPVFMAALPQTEALLRHVFEQAGSRGRSHREERR